MLLARGFSYADAHRARLGVNYQQIPVNRPRSPVRSYAKDGAMRIDPATDPVYYPNSIPGAPAADTNTYAEQAVWAADGEMVRAAYTLHAEDDDYGQANTLINQVMDDAQRERLVSNVASALSGVKRQEVLARAFEYWRNIDPTIGDKIETVTNVSNPTVRLVGTARRTAR
jgi:catalase